MTHFGLCIDWTPLFLFSVFLCKYLESEKTEAICRNWKEKPVAVESILHQVTFIANACIRVDIIHCAFQPQFDGQCCTGFRQTRYTKKMFSKEILSQSCFLWIQQQK